MIYSHKREAADVEVCQGWFRSIGPGHVQDSVCKRQCVLEGVERLPRPGAKKSTDTVWITLRRLWCQERSLCQFQWYLNIRQKIRIGLPCKERQWDMIEHNFNTDSDFILSQAWYHLTYIYESRSKTKQEEHLTWPPNTHWLTITYEQKVRAGARARAHTHTNTHTHNDVG
jgi:hypothetical protein